jgi:hypothetical protein
MTDLIKLLNTQFRQELNKAWLEATAGFDGKNIHIDFFNELRQLIDAAGEQGYLFNLEYCPDNFIAERIRGSTSNMK